MKLNIKKIDTYYINLDSKDELRHCIETSLKRLNFSSVTRISGIENDNGVIGCAKSHHKILSNKNIKVPFTVLEDDCVFTGNSKLEIEIPDDADALYIGVSQWARYLNFSGPFLHYRKVTEDVVQIYNMLATHAIIYLNEDYRRVCLKISEYASKQDLNNINPIDNLFAEIQKYYNVYSLDMPIFKQNGHNGGVTSTRITEMGMDISQADKFFDNVKYNLGSLQGVPDLNNCPSTYYPSKIV